MCKKIEEEGRKVILNGKKRRLGTKFVLFVTIQHKIAENLNTL